MSLGQNASLMETRSRGLARVIAPWIQRVARAEAKLYKANHLDQLQRLLVRHGVSVIDEFGQRAGGRELSRGRVVQDVLQGRDIQISWLGDWAENIEIASEDIYRDTRAEVGRIIKAVLLEAEQRADRQLTTTETARLINTSVAQHGNLGFERALRIARTETSIAANTGQVIAYDELGVSEIEWLAYKSPIWPRRHDKMAGKKVDLGDYFTLPDGAKCKHPGDPLLPVGHLANCRCSTAPVKKKRPR